MLAQEEYEGSTRVEAAGLVDFGYCPPSGERPKDRADSIGGRNTW